MAIDQSAEGHGVGAVEDEIAAVVDIAGDGAGHPAVADLQRAKIDVCHALIGICACQGHESGADLCKGRAGVRSRDHAGNRELLAVRIKIAVAAHDDAVGEPGHGR